LFARKGRRQNGLATYPCARSFWGRGFIRKRKDIVGVRRVPPRLIIIQLRKKQFLKKKAM